MLAEGGAGRKGFFWAAMTQEFVETPGRSLGLGLIFAGVAGASVAAGGAAVAGSIVAAAYVAGGATTALTEVLRAGARSFASAVVGAMPAPVMPDIEMDT